jgi:branched-subunit amino acid aminotransferase/4-amino-4-deoxychorismate lyase
MRIACPPKERLYAWINQLILANNVENCAVRISILVNGTVLLHATTQPKSGKVVSVISVKDTRKVRTKKIINRQVNLRAVEKAKKHFADDAIFVQKEVLIESTKANLFSMSKEGKLISPSIQGRGLDGVMRTIIKENAFFLEKEISLTTEGPLVLVNCLQIQKVKRLDDRKLINPDKLFFQIKEIVKKAENDYVRFYHE